jgi:hypothetical protein
MKMSKRFDLEQNILDCWKLVDDLDYVAKAAESRDMDTMLNLIIGLKTLYSYKFETCFENFEHVLKEMAQPMKVETPPETAPKASIEPFGY